jgi:hypothetical protein
MGEYRLKKEELRQDQIERIRKKLLGGEDCPIFVREAMDGSLLCGSSKLSNDVVERRVLEALVPDRARVHNLENYDEQQVFSMFVRGRGKAPG